MELRTVGFGKIDHMIELLKKNIETLQRLGNVTVSTDEFSFKVLNEIAPVKDCAPNEQNCRNGDCFPVHKRCDGFEDCADGSDEGGCYDRDSNINEGYPTTEATTNAETETETREMPETTSRPRGDTEVETEYPEQDLDRWPDVEPGAFVPEDETTDEPDIPECRSDEFICDVSRCVPLSSRCDQREDCMDGADEQDCGRCKPEDFVCRDGQCIDKERECNNVYDCKGGEDEWNCPCSPDEFRCNDGYCIEKRKKCDGFPNCADKSDEFDCPTAQTCGPDSFTCNNGQCISSSQLCDGVYDCKDQEDEQYCRPPNQCDGRCGDGSCYESSQRCDGTVDCADGADERDCECADDQFRCEDGNCIPSQDQCNGVADCPDGSDENDCYTTTPSQNVCLGGGIWCDGRCVSESFVCDGVKDCSDGRDEDKATICATKHPHCASYEYVCDDNSCIDYQLVCNGYPDCRDGSDEKSCDKECTEDQWQCTSGDCVSTSSLCDGKPDCQDGSDERMSSCVQTTVAPVTTPPYRTTRPTYREPPARESLDLKTYPNDQIIKQSGEVVFQCRDEGPIRAPVKWVREGGRPLPQGSTDINGRLEMPNIQVSDSGIYICQAVGYPKYTPGSELSVRLTVEPYVNQYRPMESCKIGEATCSNGDCIPKNQVCNGHYDCSDGSDELACNVHGMCEPNEFKCANKRCILKTWVCDAEDDCKDGSDEANCGAASPGDSCLPYEFQCKSRRQCISRSFHCDGQNDCQDASDEVGCSPVYISRPPPSMLILEEHSTMEITCIAHGVPSPEVVWRLNWGHIPEKCTVTSVMGVGTLTCPDIRIEDQGAYSCEALNNRGSVFAVPDTILVVNATRETSVCPAGYFNSEARVAQDCISCFCFGATTECRSADLFTYQIPPPLNINGVRLVGVNQPPGQPLQITDEPISDIFELTQPDLSQSAGIIVTPVAQWPSRDIYPYVALSENYLGTQLKSYGGYIKYTIVPNNPYPIPQVSAPEIILKGGNILLTHKMAPSYQSQEGRSVSVRLFQGEWQKNTPYGQQQASREDIMMVLANIEGLLLRIEDTRTGVKILNFQMDTAGIDNLGQGLAAFVEECKCPQGYSGLSCQKCSPGFTRVDSGRWLGRCVREEEPCQPGYYGNPSAGVPCRLCPCPLTNPGNQFSRTCKLENDGQVTCDCPVGYLGRRCEVCAPGYVGNPTTPGDSCRPAPSFSCDPRGTTSQDNNGCRCKPNVVGARCNECAPESFHLSENTLFGCSQCFCMGVTRSCTSSTMRRSLISSKFVSTSGSQSPKLLVWDENEQPENVVYMPENSLRSDPSRQEISFSDSYDSSSTLYWKLPIRYSGEKLTAYGGFLNYTLRYEGSVDEENENNSPDVQLISNNDIVLAHYNGAKPGRDGIISESVQILEQYWQRPDNKKVDREHILMALADLQSILIKASYSLDMRSTSLISASLQIADERGDGERASYVEECQCPSGYLGTSCQECAPGYRRTLEGLYLGFCSPCDCNGHSYSCHPETGDCSNCENNTYGPSCESCLPGFSRNSPNNPEEPCVPDDSTKCRCDERGSLYPDCLEGETSCRCKANVEGVGCNECVPGTFRLSASNPQGCTECYCSGVTDQCSEAQHLYKQQIPIGIIDDSHGFVLTTLDQSNVIGGNFILDVPSNQISYNFGGFPPKERFFWSLPNAFTGNKITSYNGNITITQKFNSYNNYEYSSDDPNVVIVGNTDTIYWQNSRKLSSGTSSTYQVPLAEQYWFTMSNGEAPRPISRSVFMNILSDIRLILIRATLSPSVTMTYIADVAMDIAVPGETGQPLAENIEVCRCPSGYTGTSCESCNSGYYRSTSGQCERCPCSGREEACRLGPRNDVICTCRPGYSGPDCSRTGDDEITTEEPNTYPPTQPQPSLQVIISAPTIQNKPEGGSVQFVCTARSIYSTSPIRVSWSKEGGSLPLGRTIEDSSRGLLAIRDLKVSDSGTYICRASDGISSGGDRASLTVPSNPLVPPKITISPGDLEVFEGEPIEIRCQVTGSPTPTLSWSKVNKRTMNIQHSFVDGIFRISSARPSDQGEYICTAYNPAGQDVQAVTIYVNPRPDISSRPPILTVNPWEPIVREGESLTIVCSADHSVPSNFITWTNEQGFLPPHFKSQNGQLWMDSVRYEDAGIYDCSADKFPSRVIPARVVITVQRNPNVPSSFVNVTIESRQVNIPEGESYTIKCEPLGNPPPMIKWTKDGSEFGQGVYQSDNALVINQARMSDRGVYVCLGSSMNDPGVPIAQDSVFVSIERRDKPEVLVWPEGVLTVRPGSDARLQCRVMKGAPDPILTWSRPSGRPLTGNTHLLPNGVLSFTSITVNEEGVYTCTGSNVAGEKSANATVKLSAPPTISISPDTYISTQAGRDIVFECRADGYPQPIVHWIKVSPEKTLTTDHSGSATLTLPAVNEDDEGTYACVARNDAGIQEEKVSVSITDNEVDFYPERGDVPGPIQSRVSISSAKNLTRYIGDSLRIDCKSMGRITEIYWTKVGSREYLNYEPYPGGSALLLDQIRPEDSGTYRCEGIEREGASTYDEINLYVTSASGSRDNRPLITSVGQPDRQQEPEVVSARLGSNVYLPCTTNLPTPVSFQWIRSHGQIPKHISDKAPTLELLSINETDAGPYICRVSHGGLEMESRKILRVTHIVPRFAGDGYLTLKTLKDAFLYFDIEVSIKPHDNNGIILYNSVYPGTTGNMVSLSLVDGIPEFRYTLSQGSTVIIKGDRPLSLDEWHTIKISRSRKNGYMSVDGRGPFTGSATSVTVGLDLTGPLYIGGVPEINQLPEGFEPRTGFVGCISRLILENVDVSIMNEALEKENIETCDTCLQNPCQNSGICQESLTHKGYTCLCAEGYSGIDCAGTGESCMPGICGVGRCTDSNEGFQCSCPIGYAGQRCESRIDIEYPAFSGKAYLAFPPPQTLRHLKVSMRVKPTYPMKDGLILYCAESRHGGHGDFTSLALKNGYLEYRYAMGDGLAVLRSRQPLSPNKWFNVTITRVNNDGQLMIEGQEMVTGKAQGRKLSIQHKTPLYIGGYDSDWLTVNKGAEVDAGFVGCISDVKLSNVSFDIKNSTVKSANIQNCGDSNDYYSNYRPHRGDIPESNTEYPSEYDDVCARCQNGGYCDSQSDEQCICPTGFEGIYCETAVSTESEYSPCDRQPCENGGTCRPTRQGNLYRCDCPKGTGGFQCRQRVDLGEDVSLAGEGYVELPAYLLPHDRPKATEVFAIAFTTSAADGLLVFQGDNSTDPKDGDFIMLNINGGYVELQWDLGGGVGTIQNSRVLVSDNERHQVVVRRKGLDATLEVDRIEDHGTAPGIITRFNADSNIYVGGVPSHLTQSGFIGFSGCIHQIEFQESRAIRFGSMAVASRNANPCSNPEENLVNYGNY